MYSLYFNSHTREGVTFMINSISIDHDDFNSHTREGVTSLAYSLRCPKVISTHTPVRV